MRPIMVGLAMTAMLLAGLLVSSFWQSAVQAEAAWFDAEMRTIGAWYTTDLPLARQLDQPERANRDTPERLRRLVLANVITSIAEETNLTVAEIRAQVKAGQTLTQIAEAGGTSSTSVQQHTLDEISLLLHQAIISGRMHEQQANTILKGLTQRLPDLMDNPELADGLIQAEEQFKDNVSEQMTVRGLAAASDLMVPDILARMRAGESIGTIARASSISSAEVVTAATPMIQQHLERPLQTGIIQQTAADAFLAEFPERVAALLAQTTRE